jgi:hypothetical protein
MFKSFKLVKCIKCLTDMTPVCIDKDEICYLCKRSQYEKIKQSKPQHTS